MFIALSTASVPAAVDASATLPTLSATPSSIAPAADGNVGSDFKVPQFAEGYHAGKKPKAGDYEPVVCALLIRTMHEYEAMVSTKDGFPDPLVRGEWARTCWQRACRLVNEQYQLTA